MKYLLLAVILTFVCGFVSAQSQGGIPEGAKTCLKGCCAEVGGEYDAETSYCNIDYETSVQESFQTCQMNCVAQNLQSPGTTKPKTAGVTEPTTLAGQQAQQSGESSSSCPCLLLLPAALALATSLLLGIPYALCKK